MGVQYNSKTGLMAISLNGVYGSATRTAGNLVTLGGSLILGGDGGQANMYNGRISCVRVFDKMLSQSQIDSMKDCTLRKYITI